MKYIIGIIITLVVVILAALGILTLWGYPVTWLIVWKAGLTMLIACITLLLLYLFFHWFFKPHDKKARN